MAFFSTSSGVKAGLPGAAWNRAAMCLAAIVIHWACVRSDASTLPETLRSAQTEYGQSRSNYLASPKEGSNAAKLARACFELADYATNSQERATLANEGIAAAQVAIQRQPDKAEGHFYLALNLGQLARTRMLSALGLIRQMEKELLRAIELDPHLDHGGPDRSIGLLYLDAPGWPASIGSKRKAREHLERAVKVEPDYPDNHLSLLEAYIRWNENELLEQGAERYRMLLPGAKKKYSGVQWVQAWHDWEERWAAIREQLGAE